MSKLFKNLVTLVTGGASGLGKATAERFVRCGSKVIICDLPSSQGKEIATEMGENVQFIAADVRCKNSVQNLVENIEKKYGKLNGVVNCAAVHNAYPFYNFNKESKHSLEDFAFVMQTNLFGTYNVIHHTAKLISKSEPDQNGHRGVIITTSGIDGIVGGRAQAATGAASRGIMSMTRPLSDKFQKNGIRVVNIATGLFKTPVTDFIRTDVQGFIGEHFMLAPHYIGDPDQYAHMVQCIFMAPHFNGTTVNMSCGFKLDSHL